jgi:hypothetical protein
MAAARLRFYQQSPELTPKLWFPELGVEARIQVGDLGLCVYRFRNHDKHVAVKVEAFTDVMSVWRRLDGMRVFHKIERADLTSSDDLARLLVACGLRHVPYTGYQYADDGGASEKLRIKNLHAKETK